MRRSTQRGVTLLELLIALFVFAMISSAGVYALRLSVDGREQLERSDNQLREWQLARLIIKDDLAQLTPRRVRDEFGQQRPAAFVGGFGLDDLSPNVDSKTLVGFVRRGWANPESLLPRSDLQYVEYALKSGDLIRRTRPYVDDARNQPHHERVLFADVRRAELTYLAGETRNGLQWAEVWPTPGSLDFAPRAVRLTIETERLGEVEQLFWIGEFHQPEIVDAS